MELSWGVRRLALHNCVANRMSRLRHHSASLSFILRNSYFKDCTPPLRPDLYQQTPSDTAPTSRRIPLIQSKGNVSERILSTRSWNRLQLSCRWTYLPPKSQSWLSPDKYGFRFYPYIIATGWRLPMRTWFVSRSLCARIIRSQRNLYGVSCSRTPQQGNWKLCYTTSIEAPRHEECTSTGSAQTWPLFLSYTVFRTRTGVGSFPSSSRQHILRPVLLLVSLSRVMIDFAAKAASGDLRQQAGEEEKKFAEKVDLCQRLTTQWTLNYKQKCSADVAKK